MITWIQHVRPPSPLLAQPPLPSPFVASTCCQHWRARQKTLPCKIYLRALWYLHYKLHNCHVTCTRNLRPCNVLRDFPSSRVIHLSSQSRANFNLPCVSSSTITHCACDEELMRFLGFFQFILFGWILLWNYNWQLQFFLHTRLQL
jgi:hypothetical protein